MSTRHKRLHNRSNTNETWARTKSDLDGALSNQQILLQARIFPAYDDGDGAGTNGLVNITSSTVNTDEEFTSRDPSPQAQYYDSGSDSMVSSNLWDSPRVGRSSKPAAPRYSGLQTTRMPQVFDDSPINIADASYATTSNGERLPTQTLASRPRSDPPRPGHKVAKESTATRTGTFSRNVSSKTTATKLPRDAYTVLWLSTTSGGYTAAQESIARWLESPIPKLSAICKFGSVDNINVVLTKSLEETEIERLIKALTQPEYFSNLGIVLVTVPQNPKQAAQVAEEHYNVQVTLLVKQKDQAGKIGSKTVGSWPLYAIKEVFKCLREGFTGIAKLEKIRGALSAKESPPEKQKVKSVESVGVVCWDIPPTTANQIRPISTELPPASMSRSGRDERIFNDDNTSCEPVDLSDIKPGASFRGICKLFFYCEGNPQVKFEGTGFMISQNTLITAGHCVFSAQYGYAIKMIIVLGYRAEANGSIKQSSESEERLAVRMGVHKRYHSNAAEAKDLAIVEVNPPFSGDVQPFRFIDTQATGTEMLTIVGFPGRDRYGGFKEAGRVMFESSGTVTWNLATNKMLHHRLDTYGGMSGAPVLWDDDEGGMVVIGVHTKWGSNANNAVAINVHKDTHELGNVITAFMRALLAQADPASQGNRCRRRELTGIRTAVSRLAEISIPLD